MQIKEYFNLIDFSRSEMQYTHKIILHWEIKKKKGEHHVVSAVWGNKHRIIDPKFFNR